jgi:MFS family permease
MESVAMVIAIVIYAFSRSAQGVAIGQFTEGIREAGFWATARTDVIKAGQRREAAKSLAYFAGLRQLADGFGRFSVGFLVFYFSFQTSLTFLFILSLLMLILVFTINKNPFKRLPRDKEVIKKIFHRRSKKFWYNAFGLTAQQIIPNILLAFLLPLYAYSFLGFDYYATAAVVAVFSLVTAAANLAALKLRMGLNSLLFFTLMKVPAFVLIPFVGPDIMPLVIVLAIGSGCGNILSEYVLTSQVSRLKDISTEIGVIYLPLRVSEFLFMSVGGLVILIHGYDLLFYACGLLTVIYVLFAKGVLKKA